MLNKLTNWLVRENYNLPKPNSECYKLAINKYHKSEKYIIGFENTFVGYEALNKVTSIIYMICNQNTKLYNKMKSEDVYIINNFYNL